MAFTPSAYGLVEQTNSGALTGPTRVQYVFSAPRRNGQMANCWSALKTAADAYETFRGYYIDLDNCRLDLDVGYWRLFLAGNSDSGTTINSRPKHGDTRWNLQLDYSTVPLENLDNFLMEWSYDLFFALDTNIEGQSLPSAAPPAVKNATDSLSGSYAGVWAYAKSQPANFTKTVGGELHTFAWTLFQRRTKGNISGKIDYTATVTEKKYFRTRTAAENALATPNTHASPGKSFGWPSASSHWLVQPDGITEEGNLYVTNNKYIYADEWDSDLYG